MSTINTQVTFFPSEETRERKLKGVRKGKKSFGAIIVDVNVASVDLAVFTGEDSKPVVTVKNVKFKDDAADNENAWAV